MPGGLIMKQQGHSLFSVFLSLLQETNIPCSIKYKYNDHILPAVNQKRERPFQKYTYSCGVPKSRTFRGKLKRKRGKLSFTTFSYRPLLKLFVLCFRERSQFGSRMSKDLAYFRLLQPLKYKMMNIGKIITT